MSVGNILILNLAWGVYNILYRSKIQIALNFKEQLKYQNIIIRKK